MIYTYSMLLHSYRIITTERVLYILQIPSNSPHLYSSSLGLNNGSPLLLSLFIRAVAGVGEKAKQGAMWAPHSPEGPGHGKEKGKERRRWVGQPAIGRGAWRRHGPTNGMSMRKPCPGLLGHGETSWIFKPPASLAHNKRLMRLLKSGANGRDIPAHASLQIKLPACTPAPFFARLRGPRLSYLVAPRRWSACGGRWGR
jgi:hypothetical protein